MIGVLACSKTKLARPAPALCLYQGDVFRLALAYLRAQGCERIVVLSAQHGAVPGDQVLAPYEASLESLGAAGRRVWAVRAGAVLRELVGDTKVLAIVPNEYAAALVWVSYERRFAGLPLGLLKQALKRHLENAA